MSSVVFADADYVPPPPPVSIWNGYDLTWHGIDGSVWNLHNLAGGVVVAADELEGLLFGQFDTYASTSVARAGRRRRGSRAKERTVQIPVCVWSDYGSDIWVQRNRSWWDSVAPDQPGTLDVSYQGRTLSIDLYYDPQDALTLSGDPAKRGWAIYMLQFVAEDPYYYGDPIVRTWSQATQAPFFPTDPGSPTSSDPLLYISPGRSLDSATMQNPGKVAAWPVWIASSISGAVTVTMSIDGGPITYTVPDGKTLVVDTDPGRGTAFLGHLDNTDPSNPLFVPETDVGGAVSPYDPRPIPPGQDVPVGFTMTGQGSVTCQILPRYFHAL